MLKALMIVDVSNIYHTVQNVYKTTVDYRKLKESVADKFEIYRAIAFGSQRPGEQAPFANVLRGLGFETHYKDYKVVASGPMGSNGERTEIRKADQDVTMAMEVVKILDLVDVVVFCTADGDLAPCLTYVRSRGKIAMVIGCKISYELKNVANDYIEISPNLLFTGARV